jgi:hypothetical protein
MHLSSVLYPLISLVHVADVASTQDRLFVRTLGLHALIREGLAAWSADELRRTLRLAGGIAIGAPLLGPTHAYALRSPGVASLPSSEPPSPFVRRVSAAQPSSPGAAHDATPDLRRTRRRSSTAAVHTRTSAYAAAAAEDDHGPLTMLQRTPPAPPVSFLTPTWYTNRHARTHTW